MKHCRHAASEGDYLKKKITGMNVTIVRDLHHGSYNCEVIGNLSGRCIVILIESHFY